MREASLAHAHNRCTHSCTHTRTQTHTNTHTHTLACTHTISPHKQRGAQPITRAQYTRMPCPRTTSHTWCGIVPSGSTSLMPLSCAGLCDAVTITPIACHTSERLLPPRTRNTPPARSQRSKCLTRTAAHMHTGKNERTLAYTYTHTRKNTHTHTHTHTRTHARLQRPPAQEGAPCHPRRGSGARRACPRAGTSRAAATRQHGTPPCRMLAH